MGMPLILLQGTDEHLFLRRHTDIGMHMGLGLFQAAGGRFFRHRMTVLRMGMYLRLCKFTDQLPLLGITVNCMFMLFESAESIRFLGNRRQNQGIGGAKYHDAHHHAYQPLP